MTESPQGTGVQAVYLSAIDSENQTFADADTAQVVDFDTLLESKRITDLGSGEFEIKSGGVYLITCSTQPTKTVASKIMYCIWLQRDIGAGFVDVAFSTTQNELTGIGMASNESKSVVYIFELKLNRGDKIRMQNSTSNTNLELMASVAAVGPVIPSAKIQITKTGI